LVQNNILSNIVIYSLFLKINQNIGSYHVYSMA
jgi:hypothetical protein